jgi:hypothetical protein
MVETKVVDVDVMSARFERNGVLKLTIKSKVLESLFTNTGEQGESGLGTHFYRLSSQTQSELANLLPNVSFGNYGESLTAGTGFNLSIFRTVGLGEGVTVEMPGLYSSEYLRKWLDTAADAAKLIYKTYAKSRVLYVEVKSGEVV